MKRIRNKKGSEVVQNLIVIAIMGALAISAFTAISGALKDKNDDVLSKIDTSLDGAYNNAVIVSNGTGG